MQYKGNTPLEIDYSSLIGCGVQLTAQPLRYISIYSIYQDNREQVGGRGESRLCVVVGIVPSKMRGKKCSKPLFMAYSAYKGGMGTCHSCRDRNGNTNGKTPIRLGNCYTTVYRGKCPYLSNVPTKAN